MSGREGKTLKEKCHRQCLRTVAQSSENGPLAYRVLHRRGVCRPPARVLHLIASSVRSGQIVRRGEQKATQTQHQYTDADVPAISRALH